MKLKLPKIFYSKSFLILVLVVLIFTIVIEYRQWQKRSQIDQEIAALISEEKELQDQNRQLEESINFLSSDSYKEKLARLQLNLQKEGEIVINFPPDADPTTNSQNTNSSNGPNFIKWWEFIFLN